ncbi:MAG: AAA family ATPase [Acidobacteriota bacterium]|nr:AAA family ATPase [Acidobacteriota bacterium]
MRATPEASRQAATETHTEAKTVEDWAHLEPAAPIADIRSLSETLERRVLGQDTAIESLVSGFSRALSGLRDPNRPLMTALLLGPTGVGKTETARAIAEALFGSDRSMTRVTGEEYSQGHEVSKLTGAPPGYVGHQVESLLTQRRIDGPHRTLREADEEEKTGKGELADKICGGDPDAFASVVLFDEIEKADPKMWNGLLGIMEEGVVTLGNNTTTDFRRSIIIMTSNVGSRQLAEHFDNQPLGFGIPGESSGAEDVQELALAAARKEFPLEFLNRFDEVLTYSALERETLDQILDKFIEELHARALNNAGMPLLIKLSDAARELLIDSGTNLRFGARPLRRAVERELVGPLSRLIAGATLEKGDVVHVEREEDRLEFYRDRRTNTALVA